MGELEKSKLKSSPCRKRHGISIPQAIRGRPYPRGGTGGTPCLLSTPTPPFQSLAPHSPAPAASDQLAASLATQSPHSDWQGRQSQSGAIQGLPRSSPFGEMSTPTPAATDSWAQPIRSNSRDGATKCQWREAPPPEVRSSGRSEAAGECSLGCLLPPIMPSAL